MQLKSKNLVNLVDCVVALVPPAISSEIPRGNALVSLPVNETVMQIQEESIQLTVDVNILPPSSSISQNVAKISVAE
ncbi:hypothetical protein K7432_009894 [Basidiobolus ranarum]|uniref:Uncharacterized protein n=1 Tax=Basidiobolus ranarum TaxID=34480 RepID=A0ABR2WPJ3_9FUNG